MTHGCLKIYARRRTATLHAYHSGSLIPGLVTKTFDIVAEHWWPVLDHRPPDTEPAVIFEAMERMCAFDGLRYATSVAALFITARPLMLEPVTPGGRKDFPSWSGLDKPYVLRVSNAGRWKFYDEEEKQLFDLDLYVEVVNRMRAKFGARAVHAFGESNE